MANADLPGWRARQPEPAAGCADPRLLPHTGCPPALPANLSSVLRPGQGAAPHPAL